MAARSWFLQSKPKKAYMAPATEIHAIAIQQFICGSVNVNGDAGITIGEDEPVPGTADSRRNNFWGDDDCNE